MRISEIPSEVRVSAGDFSTLPLDQIEALVKESERLSLEGLLEGKLHAGLQNAIARLNSALPLSESAKLQLWKLSYRLWNACVDLTNAVGISSGKTPNLSNRTAEENAKLRQIAAGLLFTAGPLAGIPSPAFKSASFFYKTGLLWHDLGKFDLAGSCFDQAADLISKITVESISDPEELRFLLDLNIARSRTAWEASEKNVALVLLNRSKSLLFRNPENCRALAEQYLLFGKSLLSKEQRLGTNEAQKLFEDAVELCDKGSNVAKRAEETLNLTNLRSRALRFLAAAHLQRQEFESVLRCVNALRDDRTCEEHPSVGFLATKAWLALGRRGEAEKELRGMVVNKEVPEEVCVSSIEAFLEGSGTVGAETVKEFFLALLGRCRVSAEAAIRVVQRLAAGGGGGGDGARPRAKVVGELVSDERVVALFAGGGKDRWNMHAVLWNCGAEHFRLKNYEMGAEMFEKSMLFVMHDSENQALRAKSFRVLCLCHLGLSQLDQAEEYINEAQKLDPNIACAFFKLKICLQKKDEAAAIEQLQSMLTCVDFNPEFLTLSAHEAMACRSPRVAVASLTTLLDLYTPGSSMPMTEVAVLRSLVAILLFHSAENDHEILNFMNRARTRMTDLSDVCFFGSGMVGSRELNWFAGNSWNMGIKTGRDKIYELSAQFFMLASEFYAVAGASEGEGGGSIAMSCKSLILSVSAMIKGEKEKHAVLTDLEVKTAIECMDRAGKILTAMPAASSQPADDPSTIQPNFFFLHAFNSYLLHRRLGSAKQLHIVQSYASSKHCTPRCLLHIGVAASEGRHADPETARFALDACLAALTVSPVPDYAAIAQVIRRLILLTGLRGGDGEADAYALYAQACRMMVGLKDGEYPLEEGKWLAATAWNRSVLPGRLGQMEAAVKWMKMGLDLARQLRDADCYGRRMEECIAGVEKLGNISNGISA